MLSLFFEEGVATDKHFLFIGLVDDPLIESKVHFLGSKHFVAKSSLLEHTIEKGLVFLVE